MKKVSARLFFTVLWKGLCQALEWFFGLFEYKKDSKFAKCVWGLLATSAAIIVGIIAIALVCEAGQVVDGWYSRHHSICEDPYCSESTFITRNIYFHNHDDGNGYIFNILTGEKCLKHVAWIAKPMGNDSLVCFSDGKKRGYFNKFTGKVAIEPKYDHAWIFSDGIASVEEGGHIKFIDTTGKTIIDKKMAYIPGMEGFVFHGGYCVVDTDDGEHCGLMDRTGNIVLPMEYSTIYPSNDFGLWRIEKGIESGVLDQELKPIIPLMQCSIYIDEGTIDVTMPDHTMRKYDLQGKLINDFYISSVRMLEYEKDEILYRHTKTQESDDDNEAIETDAVEEYHPRATARLRAYVAGDCYEGLMTADGHAVTMPLYKDISAIGPDLYICTYTNYDKVIVNGKGEIVR